MRRRASLTFSASTGPTSAANSAPPTAAWTRAGSRSRAAASRAARTSVPVCTARPMPSSASPSLRTRSRNTCRGLTCAPCRRSVSAEVMRTCGRPGPREAAGGGVTRPGPNLERGGQRLAEQLPGPGVEAGPGRPHDELGGDAEGVAGGVHAGELPLHHARRVELLKHRAHLGLAQPVPGRRQQVRGVPVLWLQVGGLGKILGRLPPVLRTAGPRGEGGGGGCQ